MRNLLYNMINLKRGLVGGCVLLSSVLQAQIGQDFTIVYNGISKEDKSPHVVSKDGNIGIKNPERGFSIRAGVIDFYSNSDYPYQPYFENITSNYSNSLTPLAFYMDDYEDDGISLVETEVYVNYKDSIITNSESLSNSDLLKPNLEILPVFHTLGVKTHLVLNSSFSYQEYDPNNVLNICEENDTRSNKNLGYFDALEPFFESINPYTAIVHLGWISAPWSKDEYRLSSHWQRTNWDGHNIYSTGFIDKSLKYKNHHQTLRESTQRSSWGQIANKASIWSSQSGINQLKKQILDKTLTSFPNQKILLKSTMAIGNHIGTTLNSSLPVNSTDQIDRIMSGSYNNLLIDENINNLVTEEGYLRFGYYDHAFGGETYDHYWTIGNGSSQNIPWNTSVSQALGAGWASNPFFTDSYNLRKYRTNLWVHGEMPVYQTEDTVVNIVRSSTAWNTSSFNMNNSYNENWYKHPYGVAPGSQNRMYDYEIGEGISSGRLQDGFYSALKLRYFNYSSFNITHNNALDGRSPYEMEDGFTHYDDSLSNGSLTGVGIPNKENTAINGWKNKLLQKNELESFGMPISDRYFEDASGNSVTRTAYDYIRDHLGYRLELKSTAFKTTSASIIFNTKVINRGFAMPQNERPVFFVLLNENNDIIETQRTNYDWRSWEPDEFAVSEHSSDNLITNPFGSSTLALDDIVIGGIPLGAQNSEWYKSAIHTNYSGYDHTLYGSFNIQGLEEGQYKVGIIMPDNDSKLYDNSDFSVKFANQALYLDCQGITVLGSFKKGNTGILDNDADGIPNDIDANPFNPIELASVGLNPELMPCGIPENLSITDNDIQSEEESIFFNSESGVLTIHNEFENIFIYDIQGKLVQTFESNQNSFSLSNLTPGVYFVHLATNDKKVIKKIVK